MADQVDLGQLIERAQAGDRSALDELFATAYQELQVLARNRLRAVPRMTVLDTVGLVGESYVRLMQSGRLRPNDRLHFLRYAAQAMRSVIVDHVRKRTSERRAGESRRVELTTDNVGPAPEPEEEILKVHAALERLGEVDARAVTVVEMRYFGGLSEQEIAQSLGITERTVRRDWAKARLLLAEAMDSNA